MADFKKLSTVELTEEIKDTTTVLIEEDGVIKRAPKGKVGGENNPTKLSDLENDLFYAKIDRVAAFDEVTMNGFFEDDGTRYKISVWDEPFSLNFPLKYGQNCVVIWDGVEYTATVEEDEGGYYIGQNYYRSGWQADVPFGIWIQNGYNGGTDIPFVLSLNPGDSHTCTILVESETYKKIESKYLDIPMVTIEKGGTGADNFNDARANLGMIYGLCDSSSELSIVYNGKYIDYAPGTIVFFYALQDIKAYSRTYLYLNNNYYGSVVRIKGNGSVENITEIAAGPHLLVYGYTGISGTTLSNPEWYLAY